MDEKMQDCGAVATVDVGSDKGIITGRCRRLDVETVFGVRLSGADVRGDGVAALGVDEQVEGDSAVASVDRLQVGGVNSGFRARFIVEYYLLIETDGVKQHGFKNRIYS